MTASKTNWVLRAITNHQQQLVNTGWVLRGSHYRLAWWYLIIAVWFTIANRIVTPLKMWRRGYDDP